MDHKADAVIIGAGIIGCAIAFELAKRGWKTINVDKLEAAGAGSTINSCCNIRAYYSTLDGVAMAYESFFSWRDWPRYLEIRDERGLAEFRNTGSVLLKNQGLDWRRVIQNFTAVGVDFEDWDLAEMKRRMPMCDFGEFWPPTRPEDERFWAKPAAELPGGVYTPGSGYVNDAQLATHNLQRAVEAKGGRFLFRAEVVEIRRLEGAAAGVTLRDGTRLEAPVVVNAAGPHSFLINRLAGVEEELKVRTRPLRHEVHHVPAPPGVAFERDGFHTNDADNGIYFRPDAGNHILVGSVDPACDPKDWVSDPDDFNRQVTQAQWQAQVYRLARRVRGLPIPNQPRGIADLYDVSDDWIPIYDKSDLKGFFMAIGTSGNQFKNAPAAGAMMAQMIEAVQQGHDQDARPLRFKLPYTGRSIDTGFYSRRRTINPESSFSVIG